jgi:hypothetical protein
MAMLLKPAQTVDHLNFHLKETAIHSHHRTLAFLVKRELVVIPKLPYGRSTLQITVLLLTMRQDG